MAMQTARNSVLYPAPPLPNRGCHRSPLPLDLVATRPYDSLLYPAHPLPHQPVVVGSWSPAKDGEQVFFFFIKSRPSNHKDNPD